MIRLLQKAAQEGVRIHLLIRGICTLVTEGENIPHGTITGTAIIDRYPRAFPYLPVPQRR